MFAFTADQRRRVRIKFTKCLFNKLPARKWCVLIGGDKCRHQLRFVCDGDTNIVADEIPKLVILKRAA